MSVRPDLLAWLGIVWFCVATGTVNASECPASDANRMAVRRLQQIMATGRFVAYQPTQIRVINGVSSDADAPGIAADLRALRPRFDGLITYGATHGADRVADVAAELGFRAVIIGVWGIDNAAELDAAIAAAARHPGLVVGISLGNERILAGEIGWARLTEAIAALRRRVPALALTSSEPFHLLQSAAAADFRRNVDFLSVNIHPIFQPWFDASNPGQAAQFVANVVHDLHGVYCGPILVKETGMPSAPATMGFSPERQAEFYKELQRRLAPRQDYAFAYFSAFDAAWRVNDSHPTPGPQPQEGSWGLYDEARNPKAAARMLAPLAH